MSDKLWLAANFQTRGYETFLCSSAAHALHTADREHFDILISDIAMSSMDGLQLIRDLSKRKVLESIPAIALSGYASQNEPILQLLLFLSTSF